MYNELCILVLLTAYLSPAVVLGRYKHRRNQDAEDEATSEVTEAPMTVIVPEGTIVKYGPADQPIMVSGGPGGGSMTSFSSSGKLPMVMTSGNGMATSFSSDGKNAMVATSGGAAAASAGGTRAISMSSGPRGTVTMYSSNGEPGVASFTPSRMPPMNPPFAPYVPFPYAPMYPSAGQGALNPFEFVQRTMGWG